MGYGSQSELVATPVTRARREFGPEELGGLDRDQLRRLLQGLLLAEGATITEVRRSADFDDFVVSISTLWGRRRCLVRLIMRPIEQPDLDDVAHYIDSVGLDEALVLPLRAPEGSLVMPRSVHLVPPGDLANRIVGSPFASWSSDGPSIAVDRLDLVLRLERGEVHDRIGVQWLPSVALNELPPALVDDDVEPQDMLERKSFRLMTASFLFDGVRYGEAARGRRLPDSVLEWPGGSACSALVDCKAAANGYVMEADHLLRFEEYWDALAPELEAANCPLRYLIVISSYFPGAAGDRHPFYGRAQDIRERTGLELAYLRASDLAWLAVTVEELEIPLKDRRGFDWHSAFAPGLVEAEHLMNMLGEE